MLKLSLFQLHSTSHSCSAVTSCTSGTEFKSRLKTHFCYLPLYPVLVGSGSFISWCFFFSFLIHARNILDILHSCSCYICEQHFDPLLLLYMYFKNKMNLFNYSNSYKIVTYREVYKIADERKACSVYGVFYEISSTHGSALTDQLSLYL